MPRLETLTNREAERALLGQVLQEPAILLKHLADFDARWMSDPQHGMLLDTLRDMLRRGQRVDLVTLPQELDRRGIAARLGGLEYVLSLPDAAPSIANPDHYAEAIRACFARRTVVARAERLAARAATLGPDELRDAVLEETRVMLAAGEHSGEAEDYGRIVDAALDAAEAQSRARLAGETVEAPVVSTGWPALDEATGGGLRRRKLTVLAGRPGMGKTAFLLELARSLALDALQEARAGERPERVLICSLEMEGEELAHRSISRESETLTHQQVARGEIRDWTAATEAGERAAALPIRVWYRPGATGGQIVGRIYAEAAKGRLRAVLVDYAQLIRLSGRGERRDLELGDVIAALLSACAEVGAALVLLSQFGRSIERNGGVPTMAALKETGALEEHAHTILGLDRPGIRGGSMAPDVLHVHGLKCRAAGTFVLVGTFDGARMRIDIHGPMQPKDEPIRADERAPDVRWRKRDRPQGGGGGDGIPF